MAEHAEVIISAKRVAGLADFPANRVSELTPAGWTRRRS